MKKTIGLIQQFIHFFYPPFKKILTFEQFRYIACGGFMAMFDVFMFYVCYNFIFKGLFIDIGPWHMSPHVASMWLPVPLILCMSFLLSRFVVFTETNLKKTTSMFRYLLLAISCFLLNFGLIKLFVEVCHMHPVVSKIACTALVAVYSYLTQKYFTFKTRHPDILPY